MTRYGVVIALAGLFTAGPWRASAHAPASFQWVALATGVYAILPSAMGSNSMIVVGDDAAMLVDTQISPALAAQLLEELATRTDRPVRYVVNTHWHIDHANGNSAVAARFPGVRILAHESVPGEVDAEGDAQRVRALDYWTEQLSATSLNTIDREALAELRRPYRLVMTDTVAATRTIDLGGRHVEIQVTGGGHTTGDLLVYVPDAGVVATGDLLLPELHGARSPLRHLASLRTLRGLDARALIPGHGDVYRNNDHLDTLIAQLARLIDDTRDAITDGAGLERAVQQVVPLAGSLLANPEGIVRRAYADLQRGQTGR